MADLSAGYVTTLRRSLISLQTEGSPVPEKYEIEAHTALCNYIFLKLNRKSTNYYCHKFKNFTIDLGNS